MMNPGIAFLVNSILLGAGLAMDAFSVSCANALREPRMKLARMSGIAGIYAFFQFLMPMIGWLCVHTVKERFNAIQGWIPWIALILLTWIGGSMLLDGIRAGIAGRRTKLLKREETEPLKREETEPLKSEGVDPLKGGEGKPPKREGAEPLKGEKAGLPKSEEAKPGKILTVGTLLLQGIATSIDALSVGFTIAGYDLAMALACCMIIAAVTFVICLGGLAIGKKAGTVLSGKADILGGVILILIGLEIVITR